ncbi:MAG: hypothetical protein HFJ95_01155 [Muribaculaceae bacterium]|jgi:hypothetical protein|nr:hypothetical protein [Muribaculaceae bacterium]
MSNRKALPHEKEDWNGYTLDELRYLRAYTAARMEINRDQLRRNFSNVKNFNALPSKGLFGKILGTLSYLDIAIMTFRIGGKVFKTVRRLRR